MTKKIFEELPARKHAPAVAAKSGGADNKGGAANNKGGGDQSGDGGSDKKIRQAVLIFFST